MEETAKHLKHFSHEHPLVFVAYSRFDRKNRACSACNLSIPRNSFFYQCKICQFSLHKVCYTMPKMVMHPSDPTHHLNLLTSSISEQCKACGRHINGFYYSCTKCSLYYHMLCVAMPISVKIPSSHPHILTLELKPPYDFQCDLCDKPSYSGWLYRCSSCEFDAHVSCAVRGIESPHLRPVYSSEMDSKSHQQELMELLSQGMNGSEVKNLDHDQSVMAFEDVFSPSIQFSDACFSIDITKATPGSTGTRLQQIPAGSKVDFGGKDMKGEVSTGINSQVWNELETKDRVKMKDQTTDVGNGTAKRSFWSKLLMCS